MWSGIIRLRPEPAQGRLRSAWVVGLGASGKSSGGLSSSLGNVPVGGAPRITVPGDPVQGQTLPNDVTPTPIPDRPGYGWVVINGRRAIVDLNTNRIYQISD
jgi:hypothetical protein